MNKTTSEYGKGFIYNLVLFAKHYEAFIQSMKINDETAKENPYLWEIGKDGSWFNAAGDHFFELEIPKQFKKTELGKLAKELQEEAIERRLGRTTLEEFNSFFERLEKLCRLIDKELGVKSVEAEWN